MRTITRARIPVLVLVSCLGMTPSLAEPRQPEFVVNFKASAPVLDENPRLLHLTPDQRKDVIAFVVGNILFVMSHELGHALISEMGLPVLGKEEDAADAFATLVALKIG